MRKARAAEWLLARLTTPQRASAIVGDFVEQGLSGTVLHTAILKLCLRLGWTWLIAVSVAFFSFFLAYAPYHHFTGAHQQAVFIAIGPRHSVAPQDLPAWLHWGGRLLFISVLLWSTPVLATIRYGWRDPIARVGAIMAILATFAASVVWAPHAAIFLPALFLATILLCLTLPSLRRALLGLLVLDVALLTTFATIGFLLDRILTAIGHSRAGGSDPAAVAFWLTYLVFQSTLLSIIRTRFADEITS